MAPKGLTFLAVLICVSALSLSPSVAKEGQDNGLVMSFYKESSPQAEDIITEQVKLLYKRHKNTAFSWLRNIFHDCVVQSCDASLLLDSTRRSLSEKETDRSFGLRNFRDGRKSKTDVVELFHPDHNESISAVLDKFGAMGIDIPSIVALLVLLLDDLNITLAKEKVHSNEGVVFPLPELFPKLDLDGFITHEDINKAFDYLLEGKCLRCIIRMDH
ncbi:hypothetical protein JHK87_009438 [Glycine soja]|nr:hypothetical protein JHK87_009438 [Glycine soja]